MITVAQARGRREARQSANVATVCRHIDELLSTVTPSGKWSWCLRNMPTLSENEIEFILTSYEILGWVVVREDSKDYESLVFSEPRIVR